MDKSSFAGVFIALGGILVGLMLEGGKILQIIQPTAALIVFGGTLGAVMLQFPLRVVIAACKRLGQLFFDNSRDPQTLINEIVSYAHKARKDGIVSLDSELEKIADPFLRKSLMLAVDGTEPQEIRKMMELELDNQAEHEEHIPRVFESAGGFCPTIGIIGAVLGLIQVMQHLDDIGEVGRGIAVAFVATIYGVGSYYLGDNIHRFTGPVGYGLLALGILLTIASFYFVHRNEERLEKEAEKAMPGSIDDYMSKDKKKKK